MLDRGSDTDQAGPKRAAQYLRMSTEGQQYSIPTQTDIISQYAAEHGLTIVRTYADEGKSGLSLRNRQGLIQLLDDIRDGIADYEVILVYDVSRWGRFQDTDEAAYYEFLCRRANIKVCYCAELFDNDGGPLSTVLKAIKRAMAAEYSRELAVKVAEAHRRGAQAGFHQGGLPGYGLRRMLLDTDGNPRGILPTGLQKGTKEERVVLVPGSRGEARTIRQIFKLYVNDRLSANQIAAHLNTLQATTRTGQKWEGRQVRFILANERYAGIYVYRKTSSRLSLGQFQLGSQENAPSLWVKARLSFPAIIEPAQFDAGRVLARKFGQRYQTVDQLLEPLKALLERHGRLDTNLINNDPGLPSAPAYHRRFGSLRNAYALIGYEPQDWGSLPSSRHRLKLVVDFVDRIKTCIEARGGVVSWHRHARLLTLNHRITVAVIGASCSKVPTTGELRWRIHSSRYDHPTLTVVVRLDMEEEILDFLCLPAAIANQFVRRAIREDAILSYQVRSFDEVAELILRKANNPEVA